MKTPLLALTGFVMAAGASLLQGDTPSLVNLSTRAQVGTGNNIIISGFVIGPGANKTVLVRGIGPALAGYGVTGALSDPVLQLFNSGGTTLNLSGLTAGQTYTLKFDLYALDSLDDDELEELRDEIDQELEDRGPDVTADEDEDEDFDEVDEL